MTTHSNGVIKFSNRIKALGGAIIVAGTIVGWAYTEGIIKPILRSQELVIKLLTEERIARVSADSLQTLSIRDVQESQRQMQSDQRAIAASLIYTPNDSRRKEVLQRHFGVREIPKYH